MSKMEEITMSVNIESFYQVVMLMIIVGGLIGCEGIQRNYRFKMEELKVNACEQCQRRIEGPTWREIFGGEDPR